MKTPQDIKTQRTRICKQVKSCNRYNHAYIYPQRIIISMKLSEELLKNENEKEKKRFQLVIDNELWQKFISKIPLSKNSTQQLTELIEIWVRNLEMAEAHET